MNRLSSPAVLSVLACASVTILSGPCLRAQETGSTTKEPATAQNGVPDRMALALRVEKAQQSDKEAPAKISAFRSTLELELTDRQQAKGALVGLDVQFLEYQKPKRKRPTTLLRYEIRKAEQPIVRGQDQYGPWHLDNGEAKDLTGAGKERDLQAFIEHKNLAKQLVRFIKPADVIRSLKNCSEVEPFELRWTRAKTFKTLKIHGDIDKFPMMRSAGDEPPARLTLYVDQETDRVVAVDVTPILNGEPDPKLGERIKLQQFQPRNGLNVPHKLSYLWRDKAGALRSHSKVTILQLDLEPKLAPKDFDR